MKKKSYKQDRLKIKGANMKNIVLCANLNDPSLELLSTLKNSPLLESAEKVYIVHCFEIQIYTSDIIAPYVFPTKDKYPELEEATVRVLDTLRDKLGLDKSKVELKCFFDESPKKKTKEFLEEVNADLCVVATRGKHGIKGLFSSSFADHLLKYSPCDIFVLRPKK